MGSDIATLLSVYTGSDIFSLRLVASDESSAPDGIHSLVRYPATSGTSYLVQVDGVSGAQGNINLNWRMGIPPTAAGAVLNILTTNGAHVLLLSGESDTVTTPSYQWQCNGTNLAGATNATYALTNVQSCQVGSYTVLVSNLVGTALSAIATLRVDAPLCIALDGSVDPASYRLTGSAPEAVVLQLSTNLSDWVPLHTNPSPLLPLNFLDTNSPLRPRGFYHLTPLP
jgi:hypothetical protein